MRQILHRLICACALAVLCVGCAERTVPLDEALHKTKLGEYSLVVVADDLISFQINAWHKYQHYTNASDIAKAVALVYDAIAVASNAGHTVIFMDARNMKEANGSTEPYR